MATWGDQTCQMFEATALGFETGSGILTGILSSSDVQSRLYVVFFLDTTSLPSSVDIFWKVSMFVSTLV